jgi:hypothetical protein
MHDYTPSDRFVIPALSGMLTDLVRFNLVALRDACKDEQWIVLHDNRTPFSRVYRPVSVPTPVACSAEPRPSLMSSKGMELIRISLPVTPGNEQETHEANPLVEIGLMK